MGKEPKSTMKRLKADVIILAFILTAALAAYVIPALLQSDEAGMISVYQDGVLLYQYSLEEEQTITVSSPEGYNLLLIGESEVRVTDADCPDQLCIRQRAISRKGESIICLPHRLVIQIDSGKESELDAVTN